MKYIKNVFALTLSVVILFTFTACSKKKAKPTISASIPTSLNTETKELISKILAENKANDVGSSDKYKAKVSVDTPKNPKMSSYDFKKGSVSSEPSSDNSSNNNNPSSGNETQVGSNSDGSSYEQKFYPAYNELAKYIMSDGKQNNGVYCISELFDEEDKNENSILHLKYDSRHCFVEFQIIDENHCNIMTYRLDVPTDKKSTKLSLHVYREGANYPIVTYFSDIDANAYNKDTPIDFKETGLSQEEELELENVSKEMCYIMVSFLGGQIADSGSGYTIRDYGFESLQ